MTNPKGRRGGSCSSASQANEGLSKMHRWGNKDSKWIECEHCSRWFHKQCATIPDSVFEFLDAIPNLLYVCDFCITVTKKKIKTDVQFVESGDLKQTIVDAVRETLTASVANDIGT